MSSVESLELSRELRVPAKYLNRHGLVVGATGSGKTVTLMRLAEEAASIGIQVIATDLKGDFRKIVSPEAVVPTKLIPLGGDRGIRIPLHELGPDGFARMIDANAVQLDAIHEVFEGGRDARLMVTIADFMRRLEAFDEDVPRPILHTLKRRARGVQQTADIFGPGRICYGVGLNVLDAVNLADEQPRGYGVLMATLLRKNLDLPEAGDLDKPRRLFIIDEAHLLFEAASPRVLADITRTLRLIRSKGVGVWFATQSPQDLPDALLDQCASRIVHGLRPGPALNAARGFLPQNAGFRTEEVLAELVPGMALASAPNVRNGGMSAVVRTTIAKPKSPLTEGSYSFFKAAAVGTTERGNDRFLGKHPALGAPYKGEFVNGFGAPYGDPPDFKTSGFRERHPGSFEGVDWSGKKQSSEGDRFIGKTLDEIAAENERERDTSTETLDQLREKLRGSIKTRDDFLAAGLGTPGETFRPSEKARLFGRLLCFTLVDLTTVGLLCFGSVAFFTHPAFGSGYWGLAIGLIVGIVLSAHYHTATPRWPVRMEKDNQNGKDCA
jgi:hypothetical protein